MIGIGRGIMHPSPEHAASGRTPCASVTGLKTAVIGPVSLSLGPGECVAVMGPSGSGKSLLLRAIADLDPNRGDVRLDGQRREVLPAPVWRRKVVYVPAETGWWADRVGAHFTDWAAVAPVIARLGLPAEVREWTVARLSSGERQRLGLARAVALAPRVLLLDEPTASLDATAIEAVEALMAEQRRSGTSILWVTHAEDQAARVAERRLLVADGTLRPAEPAASAQTEGPETAS